MSRTVEAVGREATIAELKRLITAGTYETLEKLEDAVDAFLWKEDEQRAMAPDLFSPKTLPR